MRKDKLPENMQAILAPLFDELAEIAEGIDSTEFINASHRLYEVRKILCLLSILDVRLALKK